MAAEANLSTVVKHRMAGIIERRPINTMKVHIDHRSAGIVVLTLDRPPVNALNPDFLKAVDGALQSLQGNSDVRAVVIAGAGKTFSAGMDLKEVQGFTVEDQTAMVDALSQLMARMYGFPKPVIAAVNGHAIAGGLLLLLGTDFRIAGAGALFGLAEVRVGVRFPLTALAIVRNELPPGTQRRLLLGGNTASAVAAERMGIVDEVLDPAAVMDRALAAAEDYAKIPPEAFAAVKVQLRLEVLQYITHVEARRSDPLLHGWFTDETKDAARTILEARTK
jgi:enoyl-CoA hydratase/carnithine racemase